MQVSVSKKINLAINNKRPRGLPYPAAVYLRLFVGILFCAGVDDGLSHNISTFVISSVVSLQLFIFIRVISPNHFRVFSVAIFKF